MKPSCKIQVKHCYHYNCFTRKSRSLLTCIVSLPLARTKGQVLWIKPSCMFDEPLRLCIQILLCLSQVLISYVRPHNCSRQSIPSLSAKQWLKEGVAAHSCRCDQLIAFSNGWPTKLDMSCKHKRLLSCAVICRLLFTCCSEFPAACCTWWLREGQGGCSSMMSADHDLEQPIQF